MKWRALGEVLFVVVLMLAGLWGALPAPEDVTSAAPGEPFESLAARVGRAEAWYALNAQAVLTPPGSGTIYPPTSPMLYLPVVFQNYTYAVPQPRVERRAIWVTRYDWTSSVTPASKVSVDEIITNVARAGFNTLFFQVRAAGDAYYTPGLEPWAARLTGSAGATLGQDPGWDPLAYMLERAHAANLEVHAYVNVYPAWLPISQTNSALWPPTTTPPHMFDQLTYAPTYTLHPGVHALGYTWRQHDSGGQPMPLMWNTYLWASPGVDQVQNHVVAVVQDVLARYPVDGIHLDLVRYAGRGYSYDPWSNGTAGETKTQVRDQWQRERVTDLVRRVYSATREQRPEAWVSAAVWPYYRDIWGWGTSEGYSDYYQDSKGWLAEGVIDAIAPMLYGNGDSIPDDFERWEILMADFVAASAGRHVYPGIAGYYTDFEAIAERIEAARAAGAPGHAIFSYSALDQREYWDDLASGPYAGSAMLPLPPP